jgi:integrase
VSSAWIRARETRTRQKRYQVLYRRGGRAFKLETAGTFKTMKAARSRRDVVAGWLAQGLNPQVELAKVAAPQPEQLTLKTWCERYQMSRVDFADETTKNVRSHIRKIVASSLAAKPAEAVTFSDIAELVAEWREVLKPSSIKRYVATLRLVFDFAGVDPNPARDDRVKLPAVISQEVNPPTASHFIAMLEAMPRRYWLPLVTLEQTGMRVGEAVALAWGDVDEDGCQFRLRASTVKTRRPRWVPVPGWLMSVIAATVPREDRVDDRKVFVGFTADVAKNAMARACRAKGIPVYSPHDLRHRRATIWHHDPSISLRQQMDLGGWANSRIAIDTYSHVHRLEEMSAESLERLLVMSG